MIPNVEEHEKAIISNRKSEKESRLSFICDLPAWWYIKKEAREEMQEFGGLWPSSGFPVQCDRWRQEKGRARAVRGNMEFQHCRPSPNIQLKEYGSKYKIMLTTSCRTEYMENDDDGDAATGDDDDGADDDDDDGADDDQPEE